MRNRRAFQKTRWTLAREADEGSAAALAALCQAYREPVHAFFCAHGHGAETAAALAQRFLAVQTASVQPRFAPLSGDTSQCFRSWLLGTLRGDSPTTPLDTAPEQLFHRRWALSVIERALERLEREEQRRDGSQPAARFRALRPLLARPAFERGAPAELAALFGGNARALGLELRRLRRRLGDLLYAEVADTLLRADDVSSELSFLLQAVSHGLGQIPGESAQTSPRSPP